MKIWVDHVDKAQPGETNKGAQRTVGVTVQLGHHFEGPHQVLGSLHLTRKPFRNIDLGMQTNIVE